MRLPNGALASPGKSARALRGPARSCRFALTGTYIRAYIGIVELEWDPAKAESNPRSMVSTLLMQPLPWKTRWLCPCETPPATRRSGFSAWPWIHWNGCSLWSSRFAASGYG